jgi:hypothetical protein
MCLYSLIQYTSTILTQIYYCYPSDFHYLYWDLFGNMFFFVTLGRTETVEKLTKDKPGCKLFGWENMKKVLTVVIVQAMGQVIMVKLLESTYLGELI